MKTIRNLLLVGAIIVFCGSIANAQIIYSNAFDGGAVDLWGTPPNVANNVFGGTNNALWIEALGTNNTNGVLFASGSNTCTLPNSWMLPFTPQSGHVYTITAKATWYKNPGQWIGFGFCQNILSNRIYGYGRFSDGGSEAGPQGWDWMIAHPGTGEQWFEGPKGYPAAGLAAGNVLTSNGTYTMQVTLDTRASNWVIAAYIEGVQFGSDFTYTQNPTIRGVGITQQLQNAITNVVWDNFTLTTALLPVISHQPTSQAVGVGAGYTNTVTAYADDVSGPLYYQWYDNNVAISASSTNSTLIINPVSLNDAGTNYYVVVTNLYGSVTSAPVSLTVETSPVIIGAIPASHTNVMTLFGGSSGYLGSSPTFSPGVAGAEPLTYEWLTNGVVVGGATGSSFTFTNCQMDSPTHFTCIVTNNYGTATNSWSAIYVATPTAPYPQMVLADQPIAFWRLNEGPDNGTGNNGTICNDFQSGNNGIYTNIFLGDPGYNVNEPSETATYFGYAFPSYAGQIQGVNFATPVGHNAEFTVEAWVESYSGTSGSAIITKGIYLDNDSFALNLDRHSQHYYNFSVRTPNGVVYRATSSIPGSDAIWHHIVGVCDQAHTNSYLFIDGKLVASSWIPYEGGIIGNADPVTIGAASSSSVHIGDIQLSADVADVAAYNYALSAGQIVAQYGTLGPGYTIAPYFVPVAPATNVSVATGTTLSIPTMAAGTRPLGYVWTNVTVGGIVAAGVTNTASQINATLNYSNVPLSWNGNQLELIVTNAYGSANALVTLSVSNSINLNPTNIVFSVTNGNQLVLSWPADHTGWQLQSQTNTLAVGLGTNWANVSGSTTTNQVLVPINSTNGAVFYRLIHQ